MEKRRGFDYTTVLLLLVIGAMILGMFVETIEPVEFDWDAAQDAADLYFHNVRPECVLEGVNQEYTGDVLVLDYTYTKKGETYKLVEIRENVLVGSNIRHVWLSRLPQNIHPDAFAGVEGVTVYLDWEITEDMEWAKHVTIKTSEDFIKITEPGNSYRLNFSAEQLVDFVKRWAGDEKVMLRTTAPAALLMILLCYLRQRSGRGNPLWPVFRSGIGKWLYLIYSIVVGLVTALLLFCEEVDMGLDVYGAVEFLTGWPLKVLIAMFIAFLLSDLVRNDFPWFVARWVVRTLITLLIVLVCALVGYVVAVIVTENLGLFKTLYTLGLMLFLCIIVSGGNTANNRVMTGMQSSTVISDGGSMRVDYYSYGTYVGGDQIVGFGSDTMTGASGKIYKKW